MASIGSDKNRFLVLVPGRPNEIEKTSGRQLKVMDQADKHSEGLSS